MSCPPHVRGTTLYVRGLSTGTDHWPKLSEPIASSCTNRDGIFAPAVDDALDTMSLRAEDTRPHAAGQRVLRAIHWDRSARVSRLGFRSTGGICGGVLAEWMPHNNGERPHSALGPGLPDTPTGRATLSGHSLSPAHNVVASARLGGLHHHYRLESVAA